ncbi:hypothetical protein [Tautonia sociabilis]|uniref:Carboxypeptidase regulatory-like domain-containing protein n=1 Tax=Tautonia sociabilis TaxID=2080755 RepID=A0A432MMG2_9BACT|nr:hypothetical protein [Tautonia sociabilis]RUL88306.1 hypothetical protein TsocGM_08200 [Tautonia sociabilis]
MIDRIGIRRSFSKLGLAVALAVVAPGCGSSGPEMARVSGTVTYQGQPLESGSVSFISTDPERANAVGTIGPDGSYELQTREPNDGAELGEYKIAISDIDPEAMNSALPGEPVPLTSKLPQKYQDPSTSGLTRTVERGRNTFDFDLQ